MQRPFLRATRVPLKNGHRGGFFNGYGPFYCEPVGKGEPVAQRIRENTLCPSQNGSLPVFNDGSKAIRPRPRKTGCIMAHRPSFK